jgi:hypothetical protein
MLTQRRKGAKFFFAFFASLREVNQSNLHRWLSLLCESITDKKQAMLPGWQFSSVLDGDELYWAVYLTVMIK